MSKKTDTPLVVSNLKKSFGRVQAVRDVSFSVEAGEVLGIVGPNGAGKSTTIKMILGLLEPTSGSVSLFGSTIADTKVRSRIGYMPETPSFYNHLSGAELLRVAGTLFSIPKAELATRSQELIELVGLSEAAHRPLREYSKGMLQRICLAQALINQPEIIFLDEPMDGLDPIGRIRMKETLLEIRSKGTAVVFNSHILSDVAAISDRIAIMDHGMILKLDSVSKLIPKDKTLEDVFIKTVEAA